VDATNDAVSSAPRTHGRSIRHIGNGAPGDTYSQDHGFRVDIADHHGLLVYAREAPSGRRVELRATPDRRSSAHLLGH
jgi:hypothetical protein